VLIAARDTGVRRVVYSGSSSVYGDQETLPVQEHMTPHPLNPYALQKLVGEEYIRLFHQLYSVENLRCAISRCSPAADGDPRLLGYGDEHLYTTS
jgi:nucleoside-diphosphate-sugar epimerase